MHLRQPSIDHGVSSFLWGFGLGLFLWIGMVLLEVSGATAFIFGALGGCAIFLFVRLFGERERGQATSSSSRTRMR